MSDVCRSLAERQRNTIQDMGQLANRSLVLRGADSAAQELQTLFFRHVSDMKKTALRAAQLRGHSAMPCCDENGAIAAPRDAIEQSRATGTSRGCSEESDIVGAIQHHEPLAVSLLLQPVMNEAEDVGTRGIPSR